VLCGPELPGSDAFELSSARPIGPGVAALEAGEAGAGSNIAAIVLTDEDATLALEQRVEGLNSRGSARGDLP
jgi:hypothetical protein